MRAKQSSIDTILFRKFSSTSLSIRQKAPLGVVGVRSNSTLTSLTQHLTAPLVITFDCNSNCYRKVPSSILGAEKQLQFFLLM